MRLQDSCCRRLIRLLGPCWGGGLRWSVIATMGRLVMGVPHNNGISTRRLFWRLPTRGLSRLLVRVPGRTIRRWRRRIRGRRGLLKEFIFLLCRGSWCIFGDVGLLQRLACDNKGPRLFYMENIPRVNKGQVVEGDSKNKFRCKNAFSIGALISRLKVLKS